MGKIILFYKYVNIPYPKQILKWQTKLCFELGFTGRVVLAHEGINGTLAGSESAVEKYKQLMSTHQLFGDIDFKESNGDQSCFPKMQIKVKNEIVRMDIDPSTLTSKNGGVHLKPSDVHTLLEKESDDLVVFDARNACESAIGAFKNALKPNISYFRQLPAYIDANLDLFREKKVLMYCTGGIRCERASAYLQTKGIAKEIYQLEGGIHRYLEQYPDGHFRGKNYVFDARLAIASNNDVISTCLLCNTSCDEYDNCLNASCNKHFICCNACKITFKKTCSTICKQLIEKEAVSMRPALHIVHLNNQTP
jgi:predicted sulfurtransferase